jgi:glucans biosynthesis protein C
MTSTADYSAAATAPASLAVDNLRAVVILFVLAFHSILAYLNFLPQQPFAYDSAPYLWRSFPIVDSHRWMGFDLFCAWLDVFLMSFFFMVSGLFAWPSLSRKGAGAFLSDRLLRLGLPFALVVLVLMPPALYPAYLQTAADPSITGYWRHWMALPFWPCGPVWFLWLLLVGDIAVACLFQVMSRRRDAVLRLSRYARQYPTKFLARFLVLSVLAYVPLALIFGPSEWAQRGPFPFQLSRPLHYTLYFLAGVAIGACGIERGLLAADGPLARVWLRWGLPALVSLFVWMGLTGLTVAQGDAAPLGLRLVADLSYVLACFASCFFMLATAIRFGRRRMTVLDSLKVNAYGMYLIHYLFVVWLQYALLGFDLPAIVKGLLVFAATLLLSWSATAALRREPWIAQVIGADRKPAAARPLPAPVPHSPSMAG